MTIQLSLMNGYGLAMASDRHVYRGGDHSSGEDVKLIRLRGDVPAVMMASGPFAIFGLPVARLALRLERALAAAAPEARPESLAEAVLTVLALPLEGPPRDGDLDVLAETTEHVVEKALGCEADAVTGLARVLAELEAAPACRNREALEASARAAWEAGSSLLPNRLAKPRVVEALREAPELCGRAVVGALSRDWRRAAEIFLSIGMCCPATGVPVLLALRAWRGLGQRLHIASRLDHEYEAAWRAGRTVAIAQGSGAPMVEALIDGVAEEHWRKLNGDRDMLRPDMDKRWDAAHARLAVSSPCELAALATALVRGAEAVGYLTGSGERSVVDVDCALLTPRGVTFGAMAAAEAMRIPA